MIIRELNLQNYRNYKKFNIEFLSGLNIIIGNNGIGKTNILESIYMLCLTNTFSSSFNKHTIKENNSYSLIKGKFEKEEKEIILEFMLSNFGKFLKVNGIQKKKLVNIFL